MAFTAFTIVSTSYAEIGDHLLTYTLPDDGGLFTEYTQIVTITNTAPYFIANKEPPLDLRISLN